MARPEYVEPVWKNPPYRTHIPTEEALRRAFDDEPYRSVFGDELTYQIGNRSLNEVELGILAHNLAATLHALGLHICKARAAHGVSNPTLEAAARAVFDADDELDTGGTWEDTSDEARDWCRGIAGAALAAADAAEAPALRHPNEATEA